MHHLVMIIFGVLTAIATKAMGVGWYDGNIPVALAANLIPIVIFAFVLEAVKG